MKTVKNPVLILLILVFAITPILLVVKPGFTPHSNQYAEQTSTTGPMSNNGQVEYILVVDVTNRTLSIPRNISRIVAIGPGALRLVVYLDAVDLVVGVEELEVKSCIGRDYAMAYCDYIKNLPIIGPGGPRSPPDPEKIIQVKPQLIIMSRTYVSLYPPERLESETGVPVLVVDYGSPGYLQLEDLKKALLLLGKVLNREERARSLASYIDSVLVDLDSRVKHIVVKPRVYIGAISYQGAQPFTTSQAKFAPLVLLSTPSIVDELKPEGGVVSVDFEWLIQVQPDVVFIDENNLKLVVEDFSKNKEKYCLLRAFREGRVYGVIPFNYYHTNIATAIANTYYIGSILYPEAFRDINPVEKADEVFKAFTGKPLYSLFVENGYPGYVDLAVFFKCD